MPKISTDNYDTVASWNGAQDLFIVEQPDGTKVATPAMVKQYVLGNSIDDIYSVMGQMGAKNLIPYPYTSNSYSQKGIDFTCLSDGTINANGTNDGTGNSTYFFVNFTLSKGTYVLNGCPTQTGSNYRCGVARASDSGTIASEQGSGAKFTLDADIQVRFYVQVFSGKTVSNLTFKPMLRLASDTDNTYQPYAMTNKQLTEDKADKTDIESVYSVMGQNGAKNLIPYPYYRESGYSSNGMTTTYDSDGVLTINKVAGSSTAYFSFTNNDQDYCFKPNTEYKLLFELENANQLTIYLKYGDADIVLLNKKSTGKYVVNFTTPQTLQGKENFALSAAASDTETNAKVKAMIMLASDTDDTYQPYAKTNRQLTEAIGDLSQTGLTGDSVAEQLGDAREQITQLNTALDGKCDVIILGIISATSITEALGKAWDSITIYEKPVLVRYGWQGVNMAMMYKYADSQYGMAIAIRYVSTNIYTMSVSGGTKTYATK